MDLVVVSEASMEEQLKKNLGTFDTHNGREDSQEGSQEVSLKEVKSYKVQIKKQATNHGKNSPNMQ